MKYHTAMRMYELQLQAILWMDHMSSCYCSPEEARFKLITYDSIYIRFKHRQN